jgi:hypothetical protein
MNGSRSRVPRLIVETATGVPKDVRMSKESYAIPVVCISAINCSFGDLTLWID